MPDITTWVCPSGSIAVYSDNARIGTVVRYSKGWVYVPVDFPLRAVGPGLSTAAEVLSREPWKFLTAL